MTDLPLPEAVGAQGLKPIGFLAHDGTTEVVP